MIIASFTTIPERLDKGLPERCIQTLLRQTRKADLILINIPRVSRKGVAYDVEKATGLEEQGVVVNWLDEDYGPVTKLFGTLDYIERKGLTGVQIILVDDDVKYDPRCFELLLAAGQKAAGFVSRDPVLEWGFVSGTEWHDKGQGETAFLETYAGAVYDADLFLPFAGIRDWIHGLPPFCQRADDILIGAWMARKGVVPQRLDGMASAHDAEGTAELRHDNVGGDNNNVAVLQHLFNDFEFMRLQTALSLMHAVLAQIWWILLIMGIALIVIGVRESKMPSQAMKFPIRQL